MVALACCCIPRGVLVSGHKNLVVEMGKQMVGLPGVVDLM